jgi:hypothetical protein
LLVARFPEPTIHKACLGRQTQERVRQIFPDEVGIVSRAIAAYEGITLGFGQATKGRKRGAKVEVGMMGLLACEGRRIRDGDARSDPNTALYSTTTI